MAQLSWSVTAGSPAVAALSNMGAPTGLTPLKRDAAIALLYRLVTRIGFVNAIQDVFLATAIFVLLSLVPALFLGRKGSGIGQGGVPVE